MVAKGMKDSHRYKYSSGVKAVETSKWGANTAAKRYGDLRQPDMKPKEQSAPQRLGDSSNLQGPGYANEHKEDWVRGFSKGGVESAEGKPGYDNRPY